MGSGPLNVEATGRVEGGKEDGGGGRGKVKVPAVAYIYRRCLVRSIEQRAYISGDGLALVRRRARTSVANVRNNRGAERAGGGELHPVGCARREMGYTRDSVYRVFQEPISRCPLILMTGTSAGKMESP